MANLKAARGRSRAARFARRWAERHPGQASVGVSLSELRETEAARLAEYRALRASGGVVEPEPAG